MSDAGSIKTVWVFDASQGVQVATKAERAIQGVQRASLALSTAEARAALTAGKLATEQQKTSIAATNAARASQLLARDTALAAAAQDRAALSAQRRAAAEARAAQAPAAGLGTRGGLSILPRELTQFGPEALNQIKSGLLGVVGPAALVTAGFAAVGKAIDLTEESFKLKASLDTVNSSITTQLRSIRNSSQVFQEGRVFADRYQITQAELSSTLQASIPIMRNSTASTTDLLTQISLLQATAPDKPISEAARALRELSTGDVTTIKELFNVSAKDALAMKNAIQDGADPVRVLAQYLKDSGASMELLDQRTTGATGKMNALTEETERFQLALAGQAGGPGEFLLDTRISATRKATALLSNDIATLRVDTISEQLETFFGFTKERADEAARAVVNFTGNIDGIRPATQAATQGTGAYDAAVQAATASTRANILALSEDQREKLANRIETAGLADQQVQLERDSQLAAIGMLGAGDQAVLMASKYRIATSDAQALIIEQQKLLNGTALADQRVGERDPSNTLTAAEFRAFDRLSDQGAAEAAAAAKAAADKAAQDADRLADLQFQNRLIKAKDSAAKIKILNEQLANTRNPLERQQLQNQIDQERLGAARSLGSAADKRLKTEESVYDSIQKQRDAMLDIEELTITGRQKDRDDVQKLKTANAIRAALGDRTDARAQDLRGRAEDAAALIDVQDRKRDFELEQKRATAGGAITSQGRLLQSQAGGGIPAPAGASPGGASGPTAAPSASGGTLTVNVIIDGKTAWTGIAPHAWDDFIKGARALQVGG